VIVELVPEVRDYPLAYVAHDDRLAVIAEALKQVDDDDGDRDPLQGDGVPVKEDIVHGGLYEEGRRTRVAPTTAMQTMAKIKRSQ